MSEGLPKGDANHGRVLIEACVSAAADAIAAVEAGAHRIELCAALEVGGLTPSIGLIERVVAAATVPVMVMIRPRVGDFTPSDDEFATMLADVAAARNAGAAGIVFGLLTSDSVIDVTRTKILVQAAEGLQTVFHRAIDFSPDPIDAAVTLADLGVTRVLTSGGARTALDGVAVIQQMAGRTADRLEILPGGGVRAANLAQIIRATGCNQLHLGPSISEQSNALTAQNDAPFSGAHLHHRKLDPIALRNAVRVATSDSYSRGGLPGE